MVTTLRLLDVDPARRTIRYYPFPPTAAAGERGRTRHLLDEIDGRCPNAPGVHWVSVDNVRLLIEPGADGVVYLDDTTVIWETTRFLRPNATATPLVSDGVLQPAAGTPAQGALESATIAFDPGWFNYYHWLLHTLPLTYHAKTGLQKTDIALPLRSASEGRRHGPAFTAANQEQSLQMCGLDTAVKWLEPGLYDVGRLHLPFSPQGVGREVFATGLGGEFVGQIMARAADKQSPPQITRCHIERPAGTNSRRFTAEECDLLTQLAHRAGFEPVRLEALSFVEQVNLFANASAVLGAHGSGLANIIFGTGLSVFEYANPINDEPRFRDHFQFLAHQLGHSHYVIDRPALKQCFGELAVALGHGNTRT